MTIPDPYEKQPVHTWDGSQWQQSKPARTEAPQTEPSNKNQKAMKQAAQMTGLFMVLFALVSIYVAFLGLAWVNTPWYVALPITIVLTAGAIFTGSWALLRKYPS